MSVMEEAEQAAVPGVPDAGVEVVEPAPQRVLLVWDAPNLDMGLGSILGGRPTAAHRPRFDALGRWLLARTAELSAGRPESGPVQARLVSRAHAIGLRSERAAPSRAAKSKRPGWLGWPTTVCSTAA